MSNYQMVFQGEIERQAMSWAFRASNMDNYYATKIRLGQTGTAGERAEIERYVVVKGEKTDQVALPLPFPLAANTPYQVRLRVKADRFSTMINGQVVDTWRDERYKEGGVGFFTDPGEEALVSWVRITDGEGLFDRLLSFSLLVTPQDLLDTRP